MVQEEYWGGVFRRKGSEGRGLESGVGGGGSRKEGRDGGDGREGEGGRSTCERKEERREGGERGRRSGGAGRREEGLRSVCRKTSLLSCLSDASRPSVVTAPLYRGCPCRDPLG